jgi:hypothetical protein
MIGHLRIWTKNCTVIRPFLTIQRDHPETKRFKPELLLSTPLKTVKKRNKA